MWQATADFLTYLNTGGDERTFKFLLMKPWQPVCISLVYILLVTVILPKFMENRKPYKLNNILIIYNAVQVAISLYVAVNVYEPWLTDITSWGRCIPIPEPNDPAAPTIIAVQYIYYVNKYLEFLDTIFFVLRKKYNQVSFLHIYHHSSMPFLACVVVRFAPASSSLLGGFLNSLVHVIMYGYYLFAALGPQFQKYLTWKKYLTILQLVQFVAMFFHYTIVAFSGEQCNLPSFLLMIICSNVVVNLTLFLFFYRRTYKLKNKIKEGRKINIEDMPPRKNIKSS